MRTIAMSTCLALIVLTATSAIGGPGGPPSTCNTTELLLYENDADGRPRNDAKISKLAAAIDDGRGIRIVLAFERKKEELSFDLTSVWLSADKKLAMGQGSALYEVDPENLTGTGLLVIPAVNSEGIYSVTPKGEHRKAYMCWYAR